MRRSNEKCEQITSSGIILNDYAEILDRKEMSTIILKYFPNSQYVNDNIYGEYENIKYSVYFKNVSYLGNPHPLHKKRIQIPSSFVNIYKENKSKGIRTLLIGIYKYKGNIIFTDFNIDTYLTRDLHNSSAHVYSNDLRNAIIHQVFEKVDRNNNKILTFLPKVTTEYLSQKLLNEESFQLPFIEYFDAFFDDINKKLYGIDCYKEMNSDNYRNTKQAEWPGFYIEYKFEKYLNRFDLSAVIQFLHNKSKNAIDLDLYFPTIKSYGDLKTHENKSNSILGNDLKTVKKVILNSSLYYVVCNHNAEKDKMHGSRVTKYWNKLCEKKDLHSYESKMKSSINITNYEVLEINKFNKKYLKIFNQGQNSNNQTRAPKIMIGQRDINNFLIHYREY